MTIHPICKILEENGSAIIFGTAIIFAIIHLFFTFVIDSITVILIIIALIPFLASYVDFIKIHGCEIGLWKQMGQNISKPQEDGVNERRLKNDPTYTNQKQKDIDSIRNSIKNSFLNKSPAEKIMIIRYEVDRQYERIIQKLKIDPLAKNKLLDKLLTDEKINYKEAMSIRQSIDLLDCAAQTKDIGPISANVVIDVGLKLIEFLNEII